MIKGIKLKGKIALWLVSAGLILTIGIYFFPQEYGKKSFWEILYTTLRLFVFEHDQQTFPKSWELILIYFLAPAVTISAVGTAISYFFQLTPAIKTRWLSDHIVICGMGRTGKLFTSTIKTKGLKVVGIDQGPPDNFDEWVAHSRVPMVFGDFNSRTVLEKTGAARARSIIFASGDDLANLEGALSAYKWLQSDNEPIRIIWAQITNDQLANTAGDALRTTGKVGIRFFDTYRIAALRMVERYFGREKREGLREINILGFGKFGSDLLDVLVHNLQSDEQYNIRIIDKLDRENEVRSMAENLGVADRVSFRKSAIQDLKLGGQVKRAYFVCTDDDMGNLIAAMSLACDINATRIYVRMEHWPLSGVAENLGEDRGVMFINIKDLVIQGLENLPGIFKPPAASDLERTKLECSSPKTPDDCS